MEEKILVDYPKCPWCGHNQTLTQKAWLELHGNDEKKDMFVSFNKMVAVLTDTPPQFGVTLPTAPGLLVHQDFCAKCGRLWTTRAELKNLPTGMQIQSGPQPGGTFHPQR